MTTTTSTTNNSNPYAAITGSSATSTTTTANAPKTTLDQSDFLSLMTAQLQNQDPFAPVDNTQMVAQMAQFSQLAGISQMNTTLQTLATKLGGTSTSDALSYVGKTVLVEGSTAYPRTSGGLSGGVEVASDASDVTVQIQDKNGGVLKTIDLGAQKSGTVSFDWDGTTDDGTTAGSGPFTINTVAENNGTTVASQPLVWAPVDSVSLQSGGAPILNVTGVGQVDPSAVFQIG
jgi:flagellar basal-body rod modification protein FlgD